MSSYNSWQLLLPHPLNYSFKPPLPFGLQCSQPCKSSSRIQGKKLPSQLLAFVWERGWESVCVSVNVYVSHLVHYFIFSKFYYQKKPAEMCKTTMEIIQVVPSTPVILRWKILRPLLLLLNSLSSQTYFHDVVYPPNDTSVIVIIIILIWAEQHV